MKVSIVECDDYDKELVFAAVKKAITDIVFTIPSRKKVLLKPNILGQHKPEECITTHPSVVEAVIRLFLEQNCEVIIGESSGFFLEGGTTKALELSGMKKIAEKYKIKLVNLEQIPVKQIRDDEARMYKNLQISKLLFDVDLVVNLPKLKTHTLMKYTGAVKNLFGTIPGGRKQQLHAMGRNESDFGNILVDIYQNIKPGLNIMDGIIGLEGNGPGTGGIPKKTGLIIASTSAPSLDIVVSEMIGFNASDILTNKFCIERKLVEPDKIEVIGAKKFIPYKKPINAPDFASPIIGWVMKHAALRPYAIKSKCRKCGVCRDVCPMKLIKLDPFPVINKKRCISCYCCHENCPYNAMELRAPIVIRFAKKAKDFVFRKIEKD
jgi:uncharacterized protein (DUF362 family)/NAD-dependent dihydropyrimidine dehydrogenase PreA subunit